MGTRATLSWHGHASYEKASSRQSSPSRNMLRMGSWKLSFTCPIHSPRRSPRLRQQFRLDDRRSIWVSSVDRKSLTAEYGVELMADRDISSEEHGGTETPETNVPAKT